MNGGQNFGQSALGRGGDGRGPFSARTSYTGFGRVESLWDDEQECEDAGGEFGRDNNDGVGKGSGGGRSAHGVRGREDNEFFPDARSEKTQAMQPLAAVSESSSVTGVFCEQGSRDSYSRLSHSSRPGETFGAYAEMERDHGGGRARDSEDRPPAAPYVGGFGGAGGGSTGMSIPTTNSSGWEKQVDGRDNGRFKTDEVVAGRDSGLFSTNEVVDRNGRRFSAGYGDGSREDGRREGGAFERDTLPDNRKGVQRANHSLPEPKGGEGQGHVRSTQDILSLFGFAESPSGGQNNDNPLQEGGGGLLSAPLRSCGPNEISPALARCTHDTETLGDVDLESTPGNFVVPVTGKGRAADMRRAQHAARAVKPPVSAGFQAGMAAGVAAASAVEASVPSDWECGVCGVRGSSSSISCRVCGAKRRPRRNDGGGDVGGDGGGGGGGVGDGGGGGRGGGHNDGVYGGGGDGGGRGYDGDSFDNERGDVDFLDGDRLGGSHGSQRPGEENDAADKGAESIGVSGYFGSDGVPRRREVDYEDMLRERKVGNTPGSNAEGGSCREEGVEDLSRNPPGCRSFSPPGEEGVATAGGSASPSGAQSKRQIAGVRMQMDLGSSSDSEND